MKPIVYLSTAVELMTDQPLTDLLTVACKNNAFRNVSGILLYSEGTFLQVLEGAEDDVDKIFNIIAKDPRHKNLVTLADEPINQREFANWSSGFTSVSLSQAIDLSGYLMPGNKLNLDNGDSTARLCSKLL
ncbi:BLUF domain-containing protein [Mucilaginibacter glaciei]|uniref:BLUF domain-containing protein n=1 Tax=Mucilaginibacter glaciei TaxID=2772109 RepID=A0A926S779_9SPHI|nr:BLUF domain-containing protein [Mucilaginibacter glaciei]MBD1394436.1 BLUF domain-containing protein [Mucilaginibacter glaciei]